MKTLLKLAATALLAWATGKVALATPPPPANLTITAERGQPFSLVLDGRLLTRPVARQIRLGLLVPGRHWADFSVPTAYGPPLRFRTSLWLEPGLETSYVLVLRPYGPQLRKVAVAALGGPAYGPGGYSYPGGAYPPQPGGTYGSPAPGGYYNNGQSAPSDGQNQGGYYDNGPAPDGNQGNYPGNGQPAPGGDPNYPSGGQYDNGSNQPDTNYPPPAAPPYPGTNAPNGYPAPNGSYYPGSANAGSLRVLSPTDARNLVLALRQRPFDEDRLSIAKQALSQSNVLADDLAELLKTLSFDKSRVELAKFGYAHVADPQNFYRVYSALQFSASVREVQQAVGELQR